jgi:hypothetical protein
MLDCEMDRMALTYRAYGSLLRNNLKISKRNAKTYISDQINKNKICYMIYFESDIVDEFLYQLLQYYGEDELLFGFYKHNSSCINDTLNTKCGIYNNIIAIDGIHANDKLSCVFRGWCMRYVADMYNKQNKIYVAKAFYDSIVLTTESIGKTNHTVPNLNNIGLKIHSTVVVTNSDPNHHITTIFKHIMVKQNSDNALKQLKINIIKNCEQIDNLIEIYKINNVRELSMSTIQTMIQYIYNYTVQMIKHELLSLIDDYMMSIDEEHSWYYFYDILEYYAIRWCVKDYLILYLSIMPFKSNIFDHVSVAKLILIGCGLYQLEYSLDHNIIEEYENIIHYVKNTNIMLNRPT